MQEPIGKLCCTTRPSRQDMRGDVHVNRVAVLALLLREFKKANRVDVLAGIQGQLPTQS